MKASTWLKFQTLRIINRKGCMGVFLFLSHTSRSVEMWKRIYIDEGETGIDGEEKKIRRKIAA